MFSVPVEYMKCGQEAKTPLHLTSGSVGNDIFSTTKICIYPGETKPVSVELTMKIPQGFCRLVTGRSSVTLKGIQTHVAITDNDYRGCAAVILTNIGCYPRFEIELGDRIGQISLISFSKADWIEISKFEEICPNDRLGRFGSTGNKK